MDNFSPEITASEPDQNTIETKNEEETKESKQIKLLYPEDRWAIFLEERYKISQDPFVTRKNGITVIKSGSPLWNRGRSQAFSFEVCSFGFTALRFSNKVNITLLQMVDYQLQSNVLYAIANPEEGSRRNILMLIKI